MKYHRKTAVEKVRGKLCAKIGEVELRQVGRDNFTVVYFLQVTDSLTYVQAATEYGACLMHQLACDSKLDNRMRGE